MKDNCPLDLVAADCLSVCLCVCLVPLRLAAQGCSPPTTYRSGGASPSADSVCPSESPIPTALPPPSLLVVLRYSSLSTVLVPFDCSITWRCLMPAVLVNRICITRPNRHAAAGPPPLSSTLLLYPPPSIHISRRPRSVAPFYSHPLFISFYALCGPGQSHICRIFVRRPHHPATSLCHLLLSTFIFCRPRSVPAYIPFSTCWRSP